MQFVTSKLKRFDFHKKAVSEVHERTVCGAFITVISGVIITYLLCANVMEYFSTKEINHMVPDTTIGHEDVELKFSVLFHHVKCDDISFKQEVTRGTIHTHSPEIFQKKPFNIEGCKIYGELITDKVGGNFMLVVAPSPNEHRTLQEEEEHNKMSRQFPGLVLPNHHHKPQNLAHIIESIEFEPIPNGRTKTHYMYLHEPLRMGISTDPIEGTGIYHYGLQVVPTEHVFLNYTISHSNQYSYTERSVDAQNVAFGVTLNGQQFREQHGIVFTYDFYPVIMMVRETSESFFWFLTNLCAVIGGTITMLGLFDGFIYKANKARLGKKD